MLTTWPARKKLFRRARNLVRRSRFFYLILVVGGIFAASNAFAKLNWLAAAVVATAAGVLAYRKLLSTPRPQPKPPTALVTGNPFNDLGIFTYSPTGFTVATTAGSQLVAWADINALFGYKVDAYTVDRIQLDLFHTLGYLCLTEELPGWHPFLARLAAQFPSIEPHWEIVIATPAFAPNLTLLYERQDRALPAALAHYYPAPATVTGWFGRLLSRRPLARQRPARKPTAAQSEP